MDHHERSKIRTAAFHAKRLYPGAVGELLAKELIDWEEFGYRLAHNGLINRLVTELLATESNPA